MSNLAFPRLLALLVGIVFLAVGIAGFVPGLTTNVGDMTFAGHESEAELLGVFQVSVLHNIVHIAFGVAGIAMAMTTAAALTYFFAGGIIYLALAGYGFAVGQNSDANFVPVDTADNWLHIGLGVGMIALGLIGIGASGATRARRHETGEARHSGAGR